MKILIAGFEGNDNSAKILLDNIKEDFNQEDILYLQNDFEVSKNQIEKKMQKNYDYILMFGEKPDTKNIYLENNAIIEGIKLETNYHYDVLKEILEDNNYKALISYDAGNYLCNNVFFRALDLKKRNNLKSKVGFVHIPTLENIDSIKVLSNVILNYIKYIIQGENIK